MSGATGLRPVRPPDRDGLGASVVALPPGPWRTVLDFLAHQFPPVARTEWQQRMLDGCVIDDSGRALSPEAPYRAHQRVFYYRSVAREPRIPFAEVVLYRDDLIVVADKPHFLPVAPSGRYVQETLLVRLKLTLGIDTLAPMHRIDRDTAGLVLFTIQPGTRDAYQRLFRERVVDKCYEAIAPWRADLAWPMTCRNRLVEGATFMQMQVVDGEANAETAISVIEMAGSGAGGASARYRLQPRTGQKHQLRAHMAGLGVPILNDRIYPVLQPVAAGPEDFSAPLQLLAKTISFRDPVSGGPRHFESARTLAAWPPASA